MGLIMTFVIILVFIFFIACTVGITLNNKKRTFSINNWYYFGHLSTNTISVQLFALFLAYTSCVYFGLLYLI
jgi:hypothetical protein